MIESRGKVLVGISGGPESAVAAALLKSEGYLVHAFHLACGKGLEEATGLAHCLSDSDVEVARRICAKMGISLQVADVAEEFRAKVGDYLVHEGIQSRYAAPCIPCNVDLRLAWLRRKADELGCRWIATGHYAQVTQDQLTGYARLHRAADAVHDQSLLLWPLDQAILSRLLLPLGGLSSGMVRKLAIEFGIPLRETKSSLTCGQEEASVTRFVESRTPAGLRTKGMIRTVAGKVVGSHQGLHRYRVGQKVLGLELPADGSKNLFVLGFDMKTHGLIVGPEESLISRVILALRARWVKPVDQLRPLRCQARMASSAQEVPCLVTCFENDALHVAFEQPQKRVAPGEPVVFLDGEEILGGAWAETTLE
ncbi:MAG: tRNA-specific 2-thiouridylase [Oligoflexia bacterium]|nr:tRNA-specific 2-thiouridylase [Oligoflexia bacterium]